VSRNENQNNPNENQDQNLGTLEPNTVNSSYLEMAAINLPNVEIETIIADSLDSKIIRSFQLY